MKIKLYSGYCIACGVKFKSAQALRTHVYARHPNAKISTSVVVEVIIIEGVSL